MSEILGRYRLLKRIAAGGMAEIWLAKQAGAQGFEKLVVVKRILEHLAHDEQFVEMFLDEARLAALLAHPNIVQIFDLGGDHGGWYIAMEHIHGENLRVIARRRHVAGTPGLPLNIAARVASHTCQALHYAHTKKGLDGAPLNIVHRDVSPQNILVSYEGQVKVVDFGIAKAATQNQVTRTGVIKGKFAYMSPEQCLGKRLDGRSDQFAVGSVLWELLTGVRLFERDNELLTFKAITEEDAPSPRSVKPEIPEALEAVVMRALRRDPDERYADCLEMHTELERFLQRSGELVSPTEIAGFMERLFQDRLDEWHEVVELAREGRAVDSGLLEGRSDLFEMSLTPSSSLRSSRRASAPEGSGEPSQGQAVGAPAVTRAEGSAPAVPRAEASAPTADPSDEATRLRNRDAVEAALPFTDADEPLEPPGGEPASGAGRRFMVVLAPVAVVAAAVVGLWFYVGPGAAPVATDVRAVGIAEPVAEVAEPVAEVAEPVPAAADPAPEVAEPVPAAEARAALEPAAAKPPVPAAETSAEPRPATAKARPVAARTPRPAPEVTGPAPRKTRRTPTGRRPKEADAAPAVAPGAPEPDGTEARPGAGTMVAPGYLSLNSRPWCTAFIGDRELGVTPISAVEVPAGRHVVRCVHPELGERTLEVNVRAAQEIRRSLAWLGELRFRVLPWAVVHLDGEEIGLTPLPPRKVPAGHHRVRLVNQQLGVDRTMQIEVEGDKSSLVDVDLR